MKHMKKTVRAAVLGGSVALTGAAMVASALPASACSYGHDHASGLAAGGPIPVHSSGNVATHGRYEHTSLAHLPHNKLINAAIVHSAARPGRARSSVADLVAHKLQLRASTITATCTRGAGAAHLASAVLGNHHLAVTPSRNATLTVPLSNLGTAQVTLNKQVRNSDGSLTVTAIQITVKKLLGGKTETLNLASTTCAAPAGHHPVPTPTAPGGSGGSAPKPHPVKGNLPVTG